jgi:hypothetical protein
VWKYKKCEEITMFLESAYLNVLSILLYLVLIFLSVILTVGGSMLIIARLTREIDEKKEIVDNRNVGIALVFGSFIWAIGNLCLQTVRPIMNDWYTTFTRGFDLETGLAFGLKIVVSLSLALVFGGLVIFVSIRALMFLHRRINEWKEIQKGNLAIAVTIAVTVIVVGMFFQPVVSAVISALLRL